MGRVLRLEVRKLARRPSTWIGVGALAGLICGTYVLFFAFRAHIPASGTQFLHWPDSLVYGLGYAAGYTSWTSYGTFLLMVLIAAATGQEYAWGTLQVWVARGVPRRFILGAKFLLAAAAAAVITAVCLLCVGALSLLLGTGATAHLLPLQLLLAYARTVYAMLPYAALALLLTVWRRSVAAGVGGGLAAILVVETALTNTLPLLGHRFAQAVQYLPSGLGAALNAPNSLLAGLPAAPAALQPSSVVAALALAVYSALFLGLALRILERQDLARS